MSQPLTGSVESGISPGTGHWGRDPGAAVRMRCSRGGERRPGPPATAALVSASCPSAGPPHRPACRFTPVAPGDPPAPCRAEKSGGRWACRSARLVFQAVPTSPGTQGCCSGCGERSGGLQQSWRLPLSFPEGRLCRGNGTCVCRVEPALTGRQWVMPQPGAPGLDVALSPSVVVVGGRASER